MRLQSLSTSGPALSSLLREASHCRGPFEGLILGNFHVVKTTVVDDSHDPRIVKHLDGQITRFCCSHGLGSFYDPAGHIHAGFVDDVDVEQGEQVLGWFVHRAGPKHNASARERTVTAGLAAHMPDGMPVLFGVLYVFGEHGGATITFEQKIYEQEAGSLSLSPTELRIDNLSSFNRQRQYTKMQSSYGLPRVNVLAGPANGGNTAAHAALWEQPQALESILEDMLRRLDSNLSDSESQIAGLRTLQQEVGQLASTPK